MSRVQRAAEVAFGIQIDGLVDWSQGTRYAVLEAYKASGKD